MGLWLCGVCFRTHTLWSKCRHGNDLDFVSPHDGGDGVVYFVRYDLTKPQSVFKGLRIVKSIPPRCRLGFSCILKGALDKMIGKPDCWVIIYINPLNLSTVSFGVDAAMELKEKHEVFTAAGKDLSAARQKLMLLDTAAG
nr:putative reverse transcriptase domain-containing protein [Tanacetum cinerariifolium]